LRLLGLDISSKTGWAILDDKKLVDYGLLKVEHDIFKFKPDPTKSPEYPKNVMDLAFNMSRMIWDVILKTQPDLIVIEHLVKGRNRTSQRLLEWIHKDVFSLLLDSKFNWKYVDPSEWRKLIDLRLNKEQRKNNQDVSKGKKKGRVTKKHLSVIFANTTFGLKLLKKDNDISDAIGLCVSQIILRENESKQ
jgi:hypothetical protein